jgi:hypothetical protein
MTAPDIVKDVVDMFKREIEPTDRQINALVYELYGLFPDENRIVKGK